MAKNSNFLFKIDLLILSMLKDEDKYGYQIAQEITNSSNGIIPAKNGTLYPMIHDLLENGHISSKTILEKNRARVYYHLEDSGREYLDKLTKDYDELVASINSIVHK